jgi:hypothetical protein
MLLFLFLLQARACVCDTLVGVLLVPVKFCCEFTVVFLFLSRSRSLSPKRNFADKTTSVCVDPFLLPYINSYTKSIQSITLRE